MTRFIINMLGLFFIIQSVCGQDSITYDKNKVSFATELNFAITDNRGIESKAGIIYYVEKDMQTLTAYENDKIKWRINIILICGKPTVGQPEIRFVKLDNDKLNVTFGKHSFANVAIADGKTIYLGSD
jgi:hypothetical protein